MLLLLFFLFWLIRRFSFFRKLLLSKLWNWMVLSKSAGCWIPFYNYKVGLELRVFQPDASLSNDSLFPSRWLLRQLNVHIFSRVPGLTPSPEHCNRTEFSYYLEEIVVLQYICLHWTLVTESFDTWRTLQCNVLSVI